MKILRKKVIKALNYLDFYRVKDMPPIDLRSFELKLSVFSNVFGAQSFLVDVPVSQLRAFDFIGFGLERGAGHPFVLVAEEILSGKVKEYSGSSLETYYNCIQPKLFSDVLFDQQGLLLAGDAFSGLSSLEASFPWFKNAPKKVLKSRFREMRKEARQYGKFDQAYMHWPFVGPVSKERGELEYLRLRNFLNSVSARGYCPESKHGHIGGYLLTYGEKCAVVVSGGQHRAACLSALGYESIPIMIKNAQRIAREDASDWEGVKSGFFTQAQALNIFDRVLAGRIPQYFVERW